MGLVFDLARLVANGQPAQPSFKFHDMSIFAINTGDYGLVSSLGLQLKIYAKIFKFNDISLSAIKTWIRDTSFKEQKKILKVKPHWRLLKSSGGLIRAKHDKDYITQTKIRWLNFQKPVIVF